MEKTFAMIKPDAVGRGLIGEIISRFENSGLKIEALKMINASPEIVAKLYPNDETWLKSVGQKMYNTYKRYEKDIVADMGTDDTLKLGKMVRQWLVEYITMGPIVIMILSGNHAVEVVRKLIGDTNPVLAQPGSIRGDFSVDSADFANSAHRAIYNLVHASGSVKEAEDEIALWFGGNQ
ncbi:MAG: nucleoside-diphosphate kinase [Candidatus Poribacteria bacterium]